MALPFPHHYEVTLSADEASARLLSSGRPTIVGGAPPEFDGRPDVWSPEHLLLSSVALCLMTTAQALAARARVAIARYESRIAGTLDKTPDGLVFTEIVVTVDVAVPEAQRERMAGLMESAKKHCIVSNALKVPVKVEAVVSAAAEAVLAAPRG